MGGGWGGTGIVEQGGEVAGRSRLVAGGGQLPCAAAKHASLSTPCHRQEMTACRCAALPPPHSANICAGRPKRGGSWKLRSTAQQAASDLQARQELGRLLVLKAVWQLRCNDQGRQQTSRMTKVVRQQQKSAPALLRRRQPEAPAAAACAPCRGPIHLPVHSPAAHATRDAASASSRARRAAIRPCGRVEASTPFEPPPAAPRGLATAAPRCPIQLPLLLTLLSPWRRAAAPLNERGCRGRACGAGAAWGPNWRSTAP